jgi:hypothetical protein
MTAVEGASPWATFSIFSVITSAATFAEYIVKPLHVGSVQNYPTEAICHKGPQALSKKHQMPLLQSLPSIMPNTKRPY